MNEYMADIKSLTTSTCHSIPSLASLLHCTLSRKQAQYRGHHSLNVTVFTTLKGSVNASVRLRYISKDSHTSRVPNPATNLQCLLVPFRYVTVQSFERSPVSSSSHQQDVYSLPTDTNGDALDWLHRNFRQIPHHSISIVHAISSLIDPFSGGQLAIHVTTRVRNAVKIQGRSSPIHHPNHNHKTPNPAWMGTKVYSKPSRPLRPCC